MWDFDVFSFGRLAEGRDVGRFPEECGERRGEKETNNM